MVKNYLISDFRNLKIIFARLLTFFLLTIIKLQQKHIITFLLIVLWAIVQFIASKHFDMRISVDSDLYISGAEKIADGTWPTGREFLYSSYMLILAVLHISNLDPQGVIYLHFLVAIVAIICTYELAKQITGNNVLALAAPLLYILWFKFAQWNLIVYTDALFSHMVIISIYALMNSGSRVQKFLTYILIIFTCFLRPTGIGLLLALVVYLIYNQMKEWSIKPPMNFLILLMFIIAFAIVLNWVLISFIDSFIESYKMAEIIYPGIRLFVEEPTMLVLPDSQDPPLIKLFKFIASNPIYFVKITALKGLFYIAHIKPYYSLLHNIFIAAFLYPVYFFAINGYRSMKWGGLKLVISIFLVFQFLAISLTSENWDGRFLLPILPLVFVLSSLGISNIVKSLKYFPSYRR